MNAAEQLVQLLKRPDVTEVVLASGRPPLAKMAGQHRAVSQKSLSTAEIRALIELISAPAPGAYLDRPAKWQVQTRTAGAVEVTALQRADVLQVRFVAVAAAPGEVELELDRAPRVHAPPPEPEPALTADPGSSGLELAREPGAAPRPWSDGASLEAVDSVGSGMVLDGAPAAPVQTAPAARGATRTGAGRAVDSLEALLSEARGYGASDLHVVSGRPPLFRVAGDLEPRDHAPLTSDDVERLCASLVPTRLRERFEAEGSCDFSLERDGGRYRVNLGRQRTGLKACFRIIGKEVPTLASLGLPQSIASATQHHQGLIVVTGPSGSGKTSTLAAIVNLINETTSHHVLTVEDPVEYLHPRKQAVISQREVGTHTRSFASALKGSLREDPDVIVVGELRDTETVRMAISASETGHLVIATMNTPNAAKTIDRLIDLFPPGDQAQVRMSLSTGLRLIISQRLVPTTDRRSLCVAAELLPGSIALGNLIRDEKTYQIPSLQQRGKSLGIVRLDDSLIELVRKGRTTMELALPHAQSPDEFATLPVNVAPVMTAAVAKPQYGPGSGLFGRK